MNELADLDRSLFLFLNSLHSIYLNSPMQLLSGPLMWPPLVGYFFWSSFKKNNKKTTLYFGLFLLLAILASDVTSSYIFKNVFSRLRPCRLDELKALIYNYGQKCGGKFGFVSSHAANSVALITFSVRTLAFDRKRIYLLTLIPLLVGYSRIYLGVHYPGDIFGGSLVGLFWGFFFSYLYKSAQGANR